MAKEIGALVKLVIKAGAANPAPPIGPALGAKGVNIMEFCKQFNAKTKEMGNKMIPAIITVYKDKTFEFILKRPPVAAQLKEALKIESGSGEPNRKKVGTIKWAQIKAIAEDKMVDMNCFKLESAMNMVAGQARSMGINVEGRPGKK
ncbi:MAG: 50S ribosomal protein L11 [Bacteroidetes bacterium]|nr:50S ribosomal protein L11 [Bacteroidota bacterium]